MVDFADIEQGPSIVIPPAPDRGQGITSAYLKGTTAAVQALAAEVRPPAQVLDAPDQNEYSASGVVTATGTNWTGSTVYAPGAIVNVNTWWGRIYHIATANRTSEATFTSDEAKNWRLLYGSTAYFKIETELQFELTCRDFDPLSGAITGDTYRVAKPATLQTDVAIRTVGSENHAINPPYGNSIIHCQWLLPETRQGAFNPEGWIDLNTSARFWGET